MYGVNERDWKLFCKLLPEWQERYMAKLIEEYKEILNKEVNPSERYWELYNKINKDKKNPGVLITDKSRSKMSRILFYMYRLNVINDNDIVDFSPQLKAEITIK